LKLIQKIRNETYDRKSLLVLTDGKAKVHGKVMRWKRA
jgi:hypothetical protein